MNRINSSIPVLKGTFLNPETDYPFGKLEWQDLLHGYCDSFATELKTRWPELQVYAVMETMDDGTPYPHCQGIVHMYCKDPDGNLIDARGTTDDHSLFFEEFSDWVDDDGNPYSGCYIIEAEDWNPTKEQDGYALADSIKLARAVLDHPYADILYYGKDACEEPDYTLDGIVQAPDGTILDVIKNELI